MRLDYGRCDGVLFRISLSRRLRLVQTAALQPRGGVGCGGGRGTTSSSSPMTCCLVALRPYKLLIWRGEEGLGVFSFWC